MAKLRLRLLVIAFFAATISTNAQNPELVEEYINTYKELAMSEQVRVGIPAAVTLAQGIHETGAGTSRLAKLGNNHFGIKCKRSWKGQTIKHTDDAPNECFRKYNYPLDSYKDHSDYLRNNPRYASLFKLSMTDYAAWCIGLRRAGYATNPRYAQMLIKLIENYKLQEYTYAAMGNNSLGDVYMAKRENEIVPENDPVKAPPTPVVTAPVVATPVATVPVVTETVSNSGMKVSEQRTVPVKEAPMANHPPYGVPIKVNGLRAIYGKEGQSPLEYAIKNSIRYKRFLELNDLDEKILPHDMYLYLERKHFRGVRPMHMVKPGETMHSISQKEGMQLKYLRELNFMLPGEEPVPGIVLELQNKAKEKPRVYDAPKKEVVEKTNAAPPSGYVKTNKSPIPSNPRYVPPTKESTPVNVASTSPKGLAPVSEPNNNDKPVVDSKPMATNTATVEDNSDESISALKKKFDNVIYDDPVKSKDVPTNPRYVPQEANNARTTKTVKVPVEKKPTPILAPTTTEAKAVPSTPAVAATTPVVVPAKENTVEKKVTLPVVSKRNKRKEKKKQEEVVASPPPPVVKEEPKSELDKLKAQFDAVVYDSPKEEAKIQAAKENSAIEPTITPASATVKNTVEEDPTKYYTVKEGDTAFSIAKKHKITMRQLMDWNDLDFDAIKTGMKLQVKK